MCLLTIVVSFLEVTNEFRIFKDAPDAGYVQINPDSDKIFTLLMTISIFNLINVLCRTKKFDEDREFLLDDFRVIDALEKMSKLRILKETSAMGIISKSGIMVYICKK